MDIERINDRVIFVRFKNMEHMSKTVLRIAEYYEIKTDSIFKKENRPTFRQLVNWYKANVDDKPYKRYFQGLTIPGLYITSFIRDYKPKEFSAKEKGFIDALSSFIGKKNLKRHIKYSVIMCCQGTRSSVFKHELSHTQFYLDKEFARKALGVIRRIKKEDRKAMRNCLITYGYNRDEISEEMFCRLLEKMAFNALFEGVKVSRIGGIRQQCRDLFEQYNKKA